MKNARSAYDRNYRKTVSLLASIKAKLVRHGKTARHRPTDWNLVGDLQYAASLLREVDRFLGDW